MTAAKKDDTVSRLLLLPSELRNLIYEQVLIEPSAIQITKDTDTRPTHPDGIREPSLLRTCHQIRSEARSIYYLSNKFHFSIHGLDASKLIAFCKQSGSYWRRNHFDKDSGDSQTFAFTPAEGPRRWGDFMEWLEAHGDGYVPYFYCGLGDHKEGHECFGRYDCQDCMAGDLFEVVEHFRDVDGLEWEEIEVYLEVMRERMRW